MGNVGEPDLRSLKELSVRELRTALIRHVQQRSAFYCASKDRLVGPAEAACEHCWCIHPGWAREVLSLRAKPGSPMSYNYEGEW